jgi:predicted RNA-binding protein
VTEEEYIRMRNLLDTVVEQQATFAENQRKAEQRQTKTDEQIANNTKSITALLALAEMHAEEMTRMNKEMTEQFKRTDDRINALVDVVGRYITKG